MDKSKNTKKNYGTAYFATAFLAAFFFELYWIMLEPYNYFMLLGTGFILIIMGYLTIDSLLKAKADNEAIRNEQNEMMLKAQKAIYIATKKNSKDAAVRQAQTVKVMELMMNKMISSQQALLEDKNGDDMNALIEQLSSSNAKLAKEVQSALTVNQLVKANADLVKNVKEALNASAMSLEETMDLGAYVNEAVGNSPSKPATPVVAAEPEIAPTVDTPIVEEENVTSNIDIPVMDNENSFTPDIDIPVMDDENSFTPDIDIPVMDDENSFTPDIDIPVMDDDDSSTTDADIPAMDNDDSFTTDADIPAMDNDDSFTTDVDISATDNDDSFATDVDIPVMDNDDSFATDVDIPAMDNDDSFATDVDIPVMDNEDSFAPDIDLSVVNDEFDNATEINDSEDIIVDDVDADDIELDDELMSDVSVDFEPDTMKAIENEINMDEMERSEALEAMTIPDEMTPELDEAMTIDNPEEIMDTIDISEDIGNTNVTEDDENIIDDVDDIEEDDDVIEEDEVEPLDLSSGEIPNRQLTDEEIAALFASL